MACGSTAVYGSGRDGTSVPRPAESIAVSRLHQQPSVKLELVTPYIIVRYEIEIEATGMVLSPNDLLRKVHKKL